MLITELWHWLAEERVPLMQNPASHAEPQVCCGRLFKQGHKIKAKMTIERVVRLRFELQDAKLFAFDLAN
jgi:hypothetical protein